MTTQTHSFPDTTVITTMDYEIIGRKVFKNATTRRIAYSVLFESIAIFISTALMFMISGTISGSFTTSVISTTTALVYGFGYNTLFERFEKKINITDRPLKMRALHTLGFQIGMMAVITPVMMVLLGLGFWQALASQVFLSIFFTFFNAVYTYGFDKFFGLPPRD